VSNPNPASPVIVFGVSGSGTRLSAFERDGIHVSVRPTDEDDNEKAFEVACALSRAWQTIFDLQAKVTEQATELDALRARLPAAKAARLLGRGCVRFRDGQLFLLNKRAGGWAEFAVACDGWDELFRRYNVAVVEHGADVFGPWWEVENVRAVRS
jgi:hypothetical protein